MHHHGCSNPFTITTAPVAATKRASLRKSGNAACRLRL